MSRPSDYNADLALAICDRIAGGESLRGICRDEGMPHTTTVLRWLKDHEEFRIQYARAREAQADALFDECLEIADDASNDIAVVPQEEGPDREVVNHQHIARSRLRVDTRKWLAGKLAPKKYGDKIAHVGADGGAVKHEVAVTVTPQQAFNEIANVFPDDLDPAAFAATAKGGNRVVRKAAHKGRRAKPRASKAGKAVAGPE